MDPHCKGNKSPNSNLKGMGKIEEDREPSPPRRLIRFGSLTESEFEEEKRKRNINTKELEKKLESCFILAWKLGRFFANCIDVPSDEQLEMNEVDLPKDSSLLRPRTQEELNACVLIIDVDDDDDCLSSVSRTAKRSQQSHSSDQEAKRARTESESARSEFTDDRFDSVSDLPLQFAEPNEDQISELEYY
ncbi:uncharacterized protein TNCV_1214471 [Trichonephila clavipes]|nr:uncharacterized protein TNCV_1214471 [Trichonephila clavipes]